MPAVRFAALAALVIASAPIGLGVGLLVALAGITRGIR